MIFFCEKGQRVIRGANVHYFLLLQFTAILRPVLISVNYHFVPPGPPITAAPSSAGSSVLLLISFLSSSISFSSGEVPMYRELWLSLSLPQRDHRITLLVNTILLLSNNLLCIAVWVKSLFLAVFSFSCPLWHPALCKEVLT